MDHYRFNGDWKFDLKLKKLSQLHSEEWPWYNNLKIHREKLIAGYIPFNIFPKRNYNPDPSIEQINTITYIIENEVSLKKKLFLILTKEVNFFYSKINKNTDWLPQLNSIDDLGKLVIIYEISILTESKDGYAYYQLDFNYKGDEEHGLALVLHKEKLIEYSGIGDMTYQGVYRDLGVQADNIYAIMLADRGFGADMIHQPLQKYGKFKPWQLSATEDYFRNLLITNENEVFIKELNYSKWDINFRFPFGNNNLVDIATGCNNVKMVEYLINQGADFSNSMKYCTGQIFKKEVIKVLTKHGANIDIYEYNDCTPLYNEITYYVKSISNQINYIKTDSEKYITAKEKERKHKERIIFYLKMGANPSACNQVGINYRSLLRKDYRLEFLKENGVIDNLRNIIRQTKTPR